MRSLLFSYRQSAVSHQLSQSRGWAEIESAPRAGMGRRRSTGPLYPRSAQQASHPSRANARVLMGKGLPPGHGKHAQGGASPLGTSRGHSQISPCTAVLKVTNRPRRGESHLGSPQLVGGGSRLATGQPQTSLSESIPGQADDASPVAQPGAWLAITLAWCGAIRPTATAGESPTSWGRFSPGNGTIPNKFVPEKLRGHPVPTNPDLPAASSKARRTSGL